MIRSFRLIKYCILYKATHLVFLDIKLLYNYYPKTVDFMHTDKPKPPLTQWKWSRTMPTISLRYACVLVNLRGPLCLRICRKWEHSVLLGLQLLPIPRGKAWGCLNSLVHHFFFWNNEKNKRCTQTHVLKIFPIAVG